MKIYRRLVKLLGVICSRLRATHIALLNPGLHIEGYCRFGPRCSIRVTDGSTMLLRDCTFESDCTVVADHGAHIRIEGCFIGKGTVIVARKRIEIGAGSKIAEYAVLRDQNHRTDEHGKGIVERGFDVAPIIIGRNVWLGAKSTILKDVTIGDGSVVGAHALVNREVPPLTLVAGVPARIVRRLDPGVRAE